jgi:hypothetical protein
MLQQIRMVSVMCDEKHRLVKDYETAAKFLAELALKLRRLRGQEWVMARAEFESARVECVKAREALQRHKTYHACNEPLRDGAKSRAACGGST